MSILSEFPHKCLIQKRINPRNDSVGGNVDDRSTVSSDVLCWEQPASDREVDYYQKRDMQVSRKIYFLTDPGVTERHTITITERLINGEWTEIDEDDQIELDVVSASGPDASAGLGVIYRVMVNDVPGSYR